MGKKGDKKVTIQDLAKKAGLSVGTISMALQDNPVVKKETREYAQKLAKELKYVPGALGRALVTKSTKLIGLTITDITNPFFAEIVMGVSDAVEERQHKVILSNTTYKAKKERDFLEFSMQGMFDGVIIDPVENNEDFSLYEELNDYDVPFVLLRKLEGLDNANYVMGNDKKAAMMLTEHLVEQGAKNILYAGNLTCGVTDHDRLEGYMEQLKISNIPVNKDLIFEQSSFRMEDGIVCGREILDKFKNLDAIVAFNDLLAIGIMEAAKERKMKVGTDIKIVGFDNIFYSSLKEIDLTTAELPKYELGRKSAEILFDLLKAKKEKVEIKKQQIVLEPKLVIRSSSTGR